MNNQVWAKRATIVSTVCVVAGVMLFLYGKVSQSVSFSLLITSELLVGAGLLIIGIVMMKSDKQG